MVRLISIDKIGWLKWEAVVEDGSSIYFYYAFSKRGAMKLANKHVNEGIIS